MCSFPGAKTAFLSYLLSAKNNEMYQKAKKHDRLLESCIYLCLCPSLELVTMNQQPRKSSALSNQAARWGRIRTHDFALVFFLCFRFCCSTCTSTAKRS